MVLQRLHNVPAVPVIGALYNDNMMKCLFVVTVGLHGKVNEMPEWLIVICLIFMWVHGFLLAWAICNQHDPFWRAFLDGLALRFPK